MPYFPVPDPVGVSLPSNPYVTPLVPNGLTESIDYFALVPPSNCSVIPPLSLSPTGINSSSLCAASGSLELAPSDWIYLQFNTRRVPNVTVSSLIMTVNSGAIFGDGANASLNFLLTGLPPDLTNQYLFWRTYAPYLKFREELVSVGHPFSFSLVPGAVLTSRSQGLVRFVIAATLFDGNRNTSNVVRYVGFVNTKISPQLRGNTVVSPNYTVPITVPPSAGGNGSFGYIVIGIVVLIVVIAISCDDAYRKVIKDQHRILKSYLSPGTGGPASSMKSTDRTSKTSLSYDKEMKQMTTSPLGSSKLRPAPESEQRRIQDDEEAN